MKENGAHAMAQNEATCVVYGMPNEAVKIGAVNNTELSLPDIPRAIAHALAGTNHPGKASKKGDST